MQQHASQTVLTAACQQQQQQQQQQQYASQPRFANAAMNQDARCRIWYTLQMHTTHVHVIAGAVNWLADMQFMHVCPVYMCGML